MLTLQHTSIFDPYLDLISHFYPLYWWVHYILLHNYIVSIVHFAHSIFTFLLYLILRDLNF
jgi:hypothetical protein